MGVRGFVIIIALADAMAWSAWVFLTATTNPNSAGIIIMTMFYLILLFAVAGLCVLIGVVGRAIALRRDTLCVRHVSRAFRQGIFFAALMIISLMLLHKGWFTWWIASALAMSLASLEYFFLSGEEARLT